MSKSFASLFELESRTLVPRKAGQSQSDESKERDRKFAERAAAIEKMKRTRLDMAVPTNSPRARSRKSPKGG